MLNPDIIVCSVNTTLCDNSTIKEDEIELIEIGLSMYSSNFKLISNYDSLVTPIVNPVLTNFCSRITGITQSDLTHSKFFGTVMLEISEWIDNEEGIIWGSWSNYEPELISKWCKYYSVYNPFSNLTHVNLGDKFTKSSSAKKRISSIPRALSYFYLDFIGDKSTAPDISKNIGRLLPHIWKD